MRSHLHIRRRTGPRRIRRSAVPLRPRYGAAALADPLIGQSINALEQQGPDREAGLNPRPAVLTVDRRDLLIGPVPMILPAS